MKAKYYTNKNGNIEEIEGFKVLKMEVIKNTKVFWTTIDGEFLPVVKAVHLRSATIKLMRVAGHVPF